MVDFAAGSSGVDPKLERIVECVRRFTEPELLLLFGSRANGTAREDSDYDVMIVVRDGVSKDDVRHNVYSALFEARIYADVLTRSAAEYVRWQRDPGFLDWIAAREGKLLYSAGRLPQLSEDLRRVREEPPGDGFSLWLERAQNDRRIAEQSLGSDAPVADAICFHAHASVEKLLKAEIVRAGAFPPRTHDLHDLLARQSTPIRSNPAVIDACNTLMKLLPQSRYPELPPPTLDEARECMAAVLAVAQRLSG